MLEVAQSDFSKLLADATVEEEAAIKEYEKITQENQVTKAIKEADIKYKTGEKASLEKQVSELTRTRSRRRSRKPTSSTRLGRRRASRSRLASSRATSRASRPSSTPSWTTTRSSS